MQLGTLTYTHTHTHTHTHNWDRGVLATGLPGKSIYTHIKIQLVLSHLPYILLLFPVLSGLGFSYRWITCSFTFPVLTPCHPWVHHCFNRTPLHSKTTDALLGLDVMFWNPSGHPRLLILSAFFEPVFTNLDSSLSLVYHISLLDSILSFLLTLKLNFLESSSLQCQKSSLEHVIFVLFLY